MYVLADVFQAVLHAQLMIHIRILLNVHCVQLHPRG